MCKLIVLSSTEAVADEIAIVEALFTEGLEILHWRKPDWTREQSNQRLEQLSPKFRSQVALHQHHELAEEWGTHRLHLTEKSRANVSARQWADWRKAGKILSTSIHTLESYKSVSLYVDYLFYGPVFDSISKQNYRGVIDADFQLQKQQPNEAQRIALGGITETNMDQAVAYGFDGVAVLGSIWAKPEQAVEQFRRLKAVAENI